MACCRRKKIWKFTEFKLFGKLPIFFFGILRNNDKNTTTLDEDATGRRNQVVARIMQSGIKSPDLAVGGNDGTNDGLLVALGLLDGAYDAVGRKLGLSDG
jgi:hypothetical protein